MKKYLTIIQLENYDIIRFLKWFFKNPFYKSENKIDLKYTVKTKVLILMSTLINLLLIFFVYFVTKSTLLTILVSFILYINIYFSLILSVFIFKPLDYFYEVYSILKTKFALSKNKSLKIIGITGSFGKTSTKEVLYQLLKNKFKTLRTPESYNTVLGIAKTVDYELDKSYEIFICELAAYNKGDIKKLCNLVNPNYGILTGIAPQHLERFGSIRNIINTKFELYESIKNKENMILNLNDKSILREMGERNINIENDIKVSKISFSKEGSQFQVTYKDKIYKISTNLFGYSNIENILLSLRMALKLGLDINYLIDRVKDLTPIKSRFTLINFDKTTLVDNTFSSNSHSFKETIKTASTLNGKKVLITPGLVELGSSEKVVNKEIGLLSNSVFEKVILVGKNARTLAFAEGFKGKVEFIDDNRKSYSEKIEDLKKNYEWLFLENDVTQNYN